MKQILKLLHKKLDIKREKTPFFQTKTAFFSTIFKREKLKYENTNDFSFFTNEIIVQGILNKQKIEKAYKEGIIKMNDYFETLDYVEKQRLMNYEINEILKELPYFIFEDKRIFIPFFDLKMNAIYEKDMVLFSLKQYYRIMLTYEDLMIDNLYGSKVYDSSFSSLEFIYEKDNHLALYSNEFERLYFLSDNQFNDFISVHDDKEILISLSEAFFANDRLMLVTILETNHLVQEKIIKKLKKYI